MKHVHFVLCLAFSNYLPRVQTHLVSSSIAITDGWPVDRQSARHVVRVIDGESRSKLGLNVMSPRSWNPRKSKWTKSSLDHYCLFINHLGGNILKIFWQFLRDYLIFGNILNLLCTSFLCCMAHFQIIKTILAILSDCI